MRCCESTLEERRAGNLHAAFCGSWRRVTASGDPVLGVKLPGATLHAYCGYSRIAERRGRAPSIAWAVSIAVSMTFPMRSAAASTSRSLTWA